MPKKGKKSRGGDPGMEFLRQGETFRARGQYDRALPLFEKALAARQAKYGKHHELVADAMHALASITETLGRYDDALELWEAVVALYTDLVGADSPRTVLALKGLGAVRMLRCEYDLAAPPLDLVIGVAAPGSDLMLQALRDRALVHGALGEHEDAARLLARALPIAVKIDGAASNGAAAIMYRQAEALGLAGDAEGGLAVMRRVIAIMEANGQGGQALASMREASRLTPAQFSRELRRSKWWEGKQRGHQVYKAGNYALAERFLTGALGSPFCSVQEERLELLFDRCRCWLQLPGHADDAIADARELVRLAPGRPEMHKSLVAALQLAGRDQKEVQEAMRKCGVALYGARNYAEAAGMFQAVVGVDPDNANAWFNLGAAHMALRRYRDAAEMCDEAAGRARKAGNAALEAKALEWRGRAQVKAGTKK